jgi:hypothetical protein
MSENENKIPNEEELWNVLSEDPTPEKKPQAKAAKSGGRFEKAGAPKKGKVDGFFLACMAGVAAVSVAVTMLLGGGSTAPAKTPANIGGETVAASQLELENAELRAQLELQKDQIKKLQAELLDLYAASGVEATITTEPGADNEMIEEQLKAYELFNQIKEAYAEFDREKLEELIPQMDEVIRGEYLSKEARNEYYLILEYVEQSGNG